MAITAHPVQVTSREGDRVLVLKAWVADQWLRPRGGLLSALVFYPYNLLVSLGYAVSAPFDADYDIRLGPIGAVLGVGIPGFTLIPALDPLPEFQGTWVVDPSTMQRLVDASTEGQWSLNRALRATEIWSEYWWYVEIRGIRDRSDGENAELLRDQERSHWFVHFDPSGGKLPLLQRL